MYEQSKTLLLELSLGIFAYLTFYFEIVFKKKKLYLFFFFFVFYYYYCYY